MKKTLREMEVEVIEPIKFGAEGKRKLRVAAYVRVSTDSENQQTSLINQKKEFEDKIKSNPDYEFVGVFADEGISGTTDDRPGFQRMIMLAKHNKIDLIYAKSISRFSRRVVDLIKYCDMLKAYGVDVIFEAEGIRLSTASGSLLLTVLGAVAQMESENTSERVKWTIRNKMRKYELVGRPDALGYDVVDNELVINEEEAEIVRHIFKRYLEGVGVHKIAKELESMGAKTKRGNSHWNDSTVIGIIKNKKYIGELYQGKTYTKREEGHFVRKENKGAEYAYRAKNHHDSIITLEDWEKAQEITKSRSMKSADGKKRGTTRNSTQSVFTSKLVCAYCGKNFIRRKIHAGTKYEKIVWSCSSKIKQGAASCPNSVAIDEECIKQSVVTEIKSLIDDENSFVYLSRNRLDSLLSESEKKKDEYAEQMNRYKRTLKAKLKKKDNLIDMYAEGLITKEEFALKSASIDKEIEDVNEQIAELTSLIGYEDIKNDTNIQISKLINEGKAEGFNQWLFNYIVDRIVVGGKMLKRRDDFEKSLIYEDDPKSLHFELNMLNLDTDMITEIQESGELLYTEKLSEHGRFVEVEEDDNSLCSLYSDCITWLGGLNNYICF